MWKILWKNFCKSCEVWRFRPVKLFELISIIFFIRLLDWAIMSSRRRVIASEWWCAMHWHHTMISPGNINVNIKLTQHALFLRHNNISISWSQVYPWTSMERVYWKQVCSWLKSVLTGYFTWVLFCVFQQMFVDSICSFSHFACFCFRLSGTFYFI